MLTFLPAARVRVTASLLQQESPLQLESRSGTGKDCNGTHTGTEVSLCVRRGCHTFGQNAAEKRRAVCCLAGKWWRCYPSLSFASKSVLRAAAAAGLSSSLSFVFLSHPPTPLAYGFSKQDLFGGWGDPSLWPPIGPAPRRSVHTQPALRHRSSFSIGWPGMRPVSPNLMESSCFVCRLTLVL
jgi:hypothetical protein